MSAAFGSAVILTLLACALVLTGPGQFDGRFVLVLAGAVAVAVTAPAPRRRPKGRRSK